MKINFQTTIRINVKKVLGPYVMNVTEAELQEEIKHIIGFWAEQRLREDDWPKLGDYEALREHLLENGVIGEINENEDMLLWTQEL